MAHLEIRNLEAFYGKARSLHEISLRVEKSSMVAIIGPNGAGKSTLLDSILGLTRCTGEILLGETDLRALTPAQIVSSGVGYAPERGHLFPFMEVRENLLAGAFTARENMLDRLEKVYDLFPKLKAREKQEAGTLSGGERQMVSLGRALMSNPKLLLVDEPTIGLAPKVCLDIAEALRRLNDTYGTTVVIAEQNVNFAMSLASTVFVLETGEIRAQGSVEELKGQDFVREAYFGLA